VSFRCQLSKTMSTPCSLKTPEERLEVKKLVLPLPGDLHRVVLQLTHSNEAAEDLVAGTEMRACENFSLLRDATKARQWMLRILSNTFLNSCRAKKSHQEIPFIETSEDDEQPFSLFDAVSRLSSDVGNPERQLINKLMDEEIHQAIASLPEDHRVVVMKMPGIPVGTVRSRLARGRSALQKRLYRHAQERGLITKSLTIM